MIPFTTFDFVYPLLKLLYTSITFGSNTGLILCFISQETLFDEFVLAHVIGWWGKAILIRNQPLLWVLSIGFELVEVRPDTYPINTLFFDILR